MIENQSRNNLLRVSTARPAVRLLLVPCVKLRSSFAIVALAIMTAMCIATQLAVAQSPAATPLSQSFQSPQAHAHNDYEHSRPLFDALENGFTSVEADVYLVDGELLVAHDLAKVTKQRTLESLYLSPLAARIQENRGRVYRDGPSFTLLVDIKKEGEAAYAVLNRLLSKYSSILSQTVDGRYEEKAVTVVISGDRPVAMITASNPRLSGIDGRLSDLDSHEPASLMPLISDNWNLHFKYRGKGIMNQEEKTKLAEIISKAHAKGRRVRFWATPEKEAVWDELRVAKVDFIGTDQLEKLHTYLFK